MPKKSASRGSSAAGKTRTKPSKASLALQAVPAAPTALIRKEVIGLAHSQIDAFARDLWKEVESSPAVKEAERFAREKPLKALAITLGVGIMIGMGLRR